MIQYNSFLFQHASRVTLMILVLLAFDAAEKKETEKIVESIRDILIAKWQ